MLRPSTRSLFSILIVLALALAAIPPALAQDGATITVVGGEDDPQTYPDQAIDDFTFTDMTYRSLYPGGMQFTATITPPEGVVIDRVTLFYTFATGKGGRVAAEPGAGPGEWVAVPYAGRGLPPWHEIDAYWGVRTRQDVNVNSEPVHAVYYDASREWLRTESEDVIVYWYGMPEDLGPAVLDAMAGNRDTYLAGFGEPLPYRPMAVIFPPGPDWSEYKGDETIDDTQMGFTGTTVPEAGSTIQRVRTLEPAAIRANCVWNPENPTIEFQINQAASTTVHEVAHLYQQELGVLHGPSWWIEGQATFFETFEEYPVHERLRNLAKLRGGELPSFHGDGPGGGALTTAEDGCTHMIYDMGSSFMRWLVETQGGIDTYRAVVEELKRGVTLDQALETATGQSFLDLENAWRGFLGVAEVPLSVLDPAAALDEPAEPFFAVGEQVILPATPFQQSIYNAPSVTSISDGVCFANTPVTILNAGSDGTLNWYEVDCMGMRGWMNQGQMVGP